MKTHAAVIGDGIRRETQRLASMLLDDVGQIAERAAARMQDMLPAYGRLERDELVPVVLGNMRILLEALADPGGDDRPAQAKHRAAGAARALQGITSDEMLQAWRMGVEVLREEAEAVAEDAGFDTGVLLEFVVHCLQWSDAGMRAAATAHHEAEIRELGRLAEEQKALRRVATRVAQGASAETLLSEVARQVATALHLPLVRIARFEADGSAIECAVHPQRGALFPVGTRWSLEHASVLAGVRDSRRPFRIDDYWELEGPIARMNQRAGIRSAVGVPILVAGELWGCMVASTRDPEPLAPDTEERLADFGELVGMAISNANAREEVERLAAEQAALRRVATMVARGAAPADIFARVAEEMGSLLGADASAIYRFDASREGTVVASWGRVREVIPVGSRWRLDGTSVAARVHRTQRPARIDDYRKARGSIARAVRHLGLRCTVGSPIVVNGHVWGAIVAATTGQEPLPVDAEARIAEFTELMATAISNAQARSDLAASRARIAAAADDERRRVVRDLHDGAQQHLVHTLMTLRLARAALEGAGGDPAALVDVTLREVATSIDELRELAHGILPASLSVGGLEPAVAALVARMSIPIGVDVDVPRLPQEIEAAAYFVVAEALTNVAKHARASRATVRLRLDGGALMLEVCDDGVGGVRSEGSGIVGLADRLATVDGTLRIESRAGGGTRIVASMPLP